MSAALELAEIEVTGISPAPEILWARRHLPTSGLAAYRLIRSRIALHPRQPKVLLVTSAEAGDGKSITAVNLAGTLALGGGTVLLLEGDLRRPSIHQMLGVDAEPGLVGILDGSHTLQQACRRVEDNPELFVLTAGDAGAGAGDLLQTRRWNGLIAAMRAAFHYVVIDAPPVGANSEYEWLESVCDGVVFVVRQGRTARAALAEGLERIPPGQLLGMILNDCPEPS